MFAPALPLHILFLSQKLTIHSVIALSKLYDLKDPRLADVQVKGELIPNTDGRIMTRSRARTSTSFKHKHCSTQLTHPTDPDRWTIVPATLKILKVLIVELQSATGAPLDANAAAELAEEGSDDGSWEDEPNPFVDLGSGFTKEQLMAFAADDGPNSGRQRDDETQAFLVEFFSRAATTSGFAEEFSQLNEEEKQRLRDSAA
jgi:hypothetical protein